MEFLKEEYVASFHSRPKGKVYVLINVRHKSGEEQLFRKYPSGKVEFVRQANVIVPKEIKEIVLEVLV